ncbi:MAG: CPXCG motif-containing cysteine-rich protein [Gemmatimonadetes bacterium]|nr:CPXCG motif-containing cysteine-rich protein [Gemmatimonadota bacterium]
MPLDDENPAEDLVQCPYCGEFVEITLDSAGGRVQNYVEDCEVCCRPWNVTVHLRADGSASVTLSAQDE